MIFITNNKLILNNQEMSGRGTNSQVRRYQIQTPSSPMTMSPFSPVREIITTLLVDPTELPVAATIIQTRMEAITTPTTMDPHTTTTAKARKSSSESRK